MTEETERQLAEQDEAGEEKTDREEGGPTAPAEDRPAPAEGAPATRPNPMPSHE